MRDSRVDRDVRLFELGDIHAQAQTRTLVPDCQLETHQPIFRTSMSVGSAQRIPDSQGRESPAAQQEDARGVCQPHTEASAGFPAEAAWSEEGMLGVFEVVSVERGK